MFFIFCFVVFSFSLNGSNPNPKRCLCKPKHGHANPMNAKNWHLLATEACISWNIAHKLEHFKGFPRVRRSRISWNIVGTRTRFSMVFQRPRRPRGIWRFVVLLGLPPAFASHTQISNFFSVKVSNNCPDLCYLYHSFWHFFRTFRYIRGRDLAWKRGRPIQTCDW